MSDLEQRVKLLEAQMKVLMLILSLQTKARQRAVESEPGGDLGIDVSDGIVTQDVFGRR